MKNKTSACNLQVINHKTTIKKIIRVHNSEAMDLWRPLHRWCAAWSEAVGSLLLVAQTCWFCLLFGRHGRQSFHEFSVEHLLWCVPGWALCTLTVLPSLWQHVPEGSNSGGGWHSPDPGSADRMGLGSLPQGWLWSTGSLVALLPPLGVPCHHKG